MQLPFYLLLAVALIPAAANGKSPEDDIIERLRSEEDPTILKPRVWLDTESNRFRDSSKDLDLTVGRLWAWRRSENQDWGLRLKVPLRTHQAGATPGDSDRQGLGDIKLAAAVAARLDERWRAAGGLEMRFPTAGDNLGSNAWRPMLFGAVAWDLTPAITFSPSVEYNKSIKEVNGAAPQRFVELFLPVTFLLPGRWAVSSSYEYKVDYANSDQVTRSAKLAVSKQLADRPWGFTFSVKKPIDEIAKKLQVNFVAAYYFR